MRNGREDITAHPVDIKRIIKEYCEEFCAHTFDNLDEIDQFFESQFAKTHRRRNRQSE